MPAKPFQNWSREASLGSSMLYLHKPSFGFLYKYLYLNVVGVSLSFLGRRISEQFSTLPRGLCLFEIQRFVGLFP